MIMYLSMLESESDRDVFQKLYEENRQKLYHIARKKLQNEADAEDAVHTCFLRMAEKFAEYRHQPYENLLKICCTVARNAATDIAREYERKANFSDEVSFGEDTVPDIAPDILEQIIGRYEQTLVTQALMELTEDERDILTMQYGMGLKPKTIGELLGLPSEAVRKKTLRSRNKLAKILEDKGYESK